MGRPAPRRSRRRDVLAVFGVVAVTGFAAAYIGPAGVAVAEAPSATTTSTVSLYASSLADAQVSAPSGGDAAAEAAVLDRGNYTVYVTPTPTPEPEPEQPVETAGPPAAESAAWQPPFVTPDPGSAQAIAYDMVIARGWNDDEFACLVALWNRESGWRVNAYNASSGAYGIPQSLPGDKMASAGADWETNPATQITWGLGYIGARYGAPCGAWGHSQSVGWY